MSTIQVIGIVLIKNEDLQIERVIRNIARFCDQIIIADNQSEDKTFEIVTHLAKEFSHIRIEQINHPRESHQLIEPYCGTNSWIFAVDGDEIYDPAGLAKMRSWLIDGTFADAWTIFGNVLNCTDLNLTYQTAKGYLAPPCRSMTKLYNFSLIDSWTGCPERLHGGTLVFKNPETGGQRKYLHNENTWETAVFRCLHTVFIPRSSRDQNKSRWNPAELEELKNNSIRPSWLRYVKMALKTFLGKNWKYQKYRRGELVKKDVSAFLG